jgi:hypothetical protein
VEHEHARAEPDQGSVCHAESRSPLPTERLLRLQRQAGNRAVGGLLRRRLARAEAAEAPGIPSPAFTIPVETEALDITPIFNGYKAELRNYREAYVPYSKYKNCYDAAMDTFRRLTSKGLYAVSGRQPGLRTYDRTNLNSGRSGAVDWRQTDLNWNEDKVRETRDYIKAKIDQGLPVLAGVNEADTEQRLSDKTGLPINEGITDHFLIVVGYIAVNELPGWPFEEGGWRVVRLQAIDNAIDDPERSFPQLDVTRLSIRKPAWHTIGRDAADREYQLSQVRVYADDVEQLKDATAWWN